LIIESAGVLVLKILPYLRNKLVQDDAYKSGLRVPLTKEIQKFHHNRSAQVEGFHLPPPSLLNNALKR
jgi:hypothetical protein